MKTKMRLLIFLFTWVNGYVAHTQSVFAPVVGAEWNYHFISDNYNDPDYPFYQKRVGILAIKYAKDTMIRSINFKKFEQKEQYNIKGKDITYTSSKTPFYMTQRNDSIFILFGDSLRLVFAPN